jgi:chaperonin cofactor prefoldin
VLNNTSIHYYTKDYEQSSPHSLFPVSNLTRIKVSNMQSAMVSNRFILGIVAFGVSFGLSLVLTWDFSKAFLTGTITVPATYLAVLFIDKRRRQYEMVILESLHRRIKEMEGLKTHFVREINQIEEHRNLLYTESNQLQNQVGDRLNQRDILNRELSTFALQKKRLETDIKNLQGELKNIEKTKAEMTNSFSALASEKRRLDLHFNVSRVEITNLQTQICELQNSRQELESNLTLLERIKPQLEEKLHELRVQIQELEVKAGNQNELFLAKTTEKENIEVTLKALQNKIKNQQAELKHLQGQVSLLQAERDLLQSQVWELLKQTEHLHPEKSSENVTSEDEGEQNIGLYPFTDSIENIEPEAIFINEDLPEEWTNFLEQLRGYEIALLQALIANNNQRAAIKQIAEANITMPNLLIDAINERASDTIGELIIDPTRETPEIYAEHMSNVKTMLRMYEDLMVRQASTN